MKKKTNTLLMGLGFIMAGILVSGYLSVESVSAYTASITTNNSIELDITPNGDGTSIHSESINVQSDCRAGYNLTIATPEGSSLYANGDNTNTASFTAVDGTSALSSSNNTNKWGYTLTSNPTSSTVFSPLSTTASILKTPSQTASPSSDINDTFNINYGAKVDSTIAPGTYQMANSGAIVYYLTMDTTCTQYTVSFNPNGGTVAEGGNSPEQNIQIGESTKLISSDSLTAPITVSYTDADNNTITGEADKLWTFWGWNTNIDGTGDWYKDKEPVNNLTNAGSTITLYAQWKQATLADMVAGTQVGTEKVIDHNLMQDMSPEICWNSTAYSTDTNSDAHNPFNTSTNPDGYHTITLNDYRGKVTTGENPEQPEQYTVTKLADGLCWMTTNLNLGRASGGPNGDGTITLTSDDTDISNLSFVLSTLPAHTTTSSTTNTDARIRITNNSGNNANGVYYSWAAASATTVSTSIYVGDSICPKNWDLPTGSQFTNLSSKSSYSSSNQTTAAPSSFLVDGGFTNGATFYQTSYSHFWTSTSSSSSAAYGARVSSTTITTSASTGTTYGGNKYYEKNIRCVANSGLITTYYDGNGDSEYPTTGTIKPNKTGISTAIIRDGTNFTRDGYVFNGWNTEPDGSGETIAYNTDGNPVDLSYLNLKPGSTITLYAQWLPQYTITYVNNCQTYVSANASCTTTASNDTSEQKINLTNNPSTGTETGALAAYNKWTLTGWKIAGWTTSADGTGTEYRVSTTYTVPSGSSVGSGITLYAHWVPVYSIQYDGNGASNPNGMGTTNASTGVKSVTQTNVGEGDPVALLASNFKRAGYGFAGWSTNPNATVTSGDKIYGPMETISAPAYPTNGTNIITMYAVWVPAEKSDPSDPSSSPLYLQDFTASNCNALTSASFNTATGEITPGSVIALTDKRDDEVYAIAKLADDKCWMIENLRLEHEGTVGNNKNDTSITNQSLSQGYGGTTGTYGNFVGLAASESANFGNSTTSLTFANGGIYKSSANPPVDTYNSSTRTLEDIGTSNYPAYRFPRYNSNNTQSLIDSTTYTENYANANSPSTSGTFLGANLYSYGNYYTWAAAMANTNYYTSSSTSEAANTSICPTNWTLPTSGTTTKDFGTLSRSYDGSGESQSNSVISNRFRTFPNNFLYPGRFDGSSAYLRGSYGFYWSRSANSEDSSYYLFLYSTGLYPFYSYYKHLGVSVRCLIGS